jgi:hypothetical protein
MRLKWGSSIGTSRENPVETELSQGGYWGRQGESFMRDSHAQIDKVNLGSVFQEEKLEECDHRQVGCMGRCGGNPA